MKNALNTRVVAWLEALGHTRLSAEEARRNAWTWVRTRADAAMKRRGLFDGWAIVWTQQTSGTVELRPIEIRSAAAGEVTIEVLASAVSPGTERANYLRLPNARPSLPHRPGYSSSGRVLTVGPDVKHVRPGDLVAAIGAPHASVATLSADAVTKVPDGAAPAEAAFVMLGVICGQGVRRAEIRPGEHVCVVGAGIIGLLSQRMALAHGAGRATVIATSTRRRHAALSAGSTDFLVVGEQDEQIRALEATAVIEATGDPNAIETAMAAAAPSARIVLLGSPRGLTAAFPLDELRAKRLRLVGAHVNTLALGSDLPPGRPEQAAAGAFLDALATGRLSLADLVVQPIDPREAEAFYRELAAGADVTAAIFDWTLLDDGWRSGRGRLLHPPDLRMRGADITRRPLPLSRGREQMTWKGAPEAEFEGAQGMLRIGMVGCGDIALSNAAGIAKAPNARLVSCFDVDRTLAEGVASAHGARVSHSVEELLESHDVDLVFLCVPHHLHAPLAIQACEAGKHVAVEKPPANNLAGAHQMIAAAQANGVQLSVCFPQRYQPDVVAARHLIEGGAIGEVRGVFVELLTDRSPAYRRGGFSGRSISSWRESREQAGGGVLIMNLCHHIDLVHHLSRLDAEEVMAIASSGERGTEVEDTISVSVRFGNGAVGSVLGSVAVRGTRSMQVGVWGQDGHLIVESSDPRFYTLRTVDGVRTTRWQSFGQRPAPDIRAVYVSRLATALTTGEAPEIGPAEALRTQAFIEAAYRSTEAGVPVRPAELLQEVLS